MGHRRRRSVTLPLPVWLGRIPYRTSLNWQRQRRDHVVATGADEVFWLMEHPPVVTVGRRSAGDLSHVAWPIVPTERGGLATYHGPGQLVAAMVIDVASRGGGARSTVHALEQGMLTWLETVGLTGQRRDGAHGVWVSGNKIGAVGLHFRRGVTLHGFALNLDVDLSHYDSFHPCGVTDAGVTSVVACGGPRLAPAQVAHDVGEHVLGALVDTLRAHG